MIQRFEAVRCACGHRSCDHWHVDGIASVQGVRFTEPQAKAVAALLNRMQDKPTDPVMDFMGRMVRFTTPYDGHNPEDDDYDEAVDVIEDNMTGDFERDEAVAFWDTIRDARELMGFDPHAKVPGAD